MKMFISEFLVANHAYNYIRTIWLTIMEQDMYAENDCGINRKLVA